MAAETDFNEAEEFPRENELLDFMRVNYSRYCAERRKNPFYSSVLRLALSVGNRLHNGDTSLDEISETIEILTRDGLVKRAVNLSEYLGTCDRKENSSSLENLVSKLLRPDGKKADFENFREAVEKVYYGFVFTAHPTFTMTRELSRALACYAATRGGADAGCHTEKVMYSKAKIPFTPPTLNEEAEFSQEAIDNLHVSLLRLYEIIFSLAQKEYPDRWMELRPRMCSIATWVGFDLDGRNDINWTATMAARLDLQIRQIESYREQICGLLESDEALAETLKPALNLICRALIPLKEHKGFFENYNAAKDPGHKELQRASRDLIASGTVRMLTPRPLEDIVGKALHASDNDASRLKLLLLLCQLRNHGLSRCEVHFRINAAQVHNAIRKHVELTTHPADPRFRQTYMERLLAIYRKAKTWNIHFGDILEEEASALRLFMLIQQVVKHVDNYMPVRFLIAESESSFTVMACLYFAKRFGLSEKVDICPLFETERALMRGSRIVDHLLEVPEFREYVRLRGRLCIQTGFSDAGRYIGQTPAAGSIERLKERLVRLFEGYGMKDTDLLLFDTHGESTGRGGHPENMHMRMEYIAPVHFLKCLKEKGISYIQESSFQGGDGYLYFMSAETSYAALTRILEYWLTERPDESDHYYEDRAGTTEFLTIVKEFQDELMQSPDYGALISAFGTSMMRPSGSRAARRQYDYRKAEAKELYAREYRAIPHNAVLAQMGVLVNSFSGLGTAIKADPTFYSDMLERSERFRIMMRLVLRAVNKSHPDAMKAYIDTLDPMLWLMREARSSDKARAQKYSAVAEVLEGFSNFTDLNRVFRKIYADYTAFCQYDNNIAIGQGEEEIELACLNALRIALIQQIFMLAMEIPNYSPQHDIPREQLLHLIFRLEIPLADRELREIFPVNPDDGNNAEYGEHSDYSQEEKEIYAEEQERIFDPLLRLYELVQDVSAAVNHHIGFSG